MSGNLSLDYLVSVHLTNIKKAEDEGLIVNEATPTELQLDFDKDNPQPIDFYDRCIIVEENFTERITFRETTSPGGNTHVYLNFDTPLDIHTRIILQLYLGSDPIRELLNLKRVLAGTPKPIILYEKGTPHADRNDNPGKDQSSPAANPPVGSTRIGEDSLRHLLR